MKLEHYILLSGTPEEKAELLRNTFDTAGTNIIKAFVWFTLKLPNIEKYAFHYGGRSLSNIDNFPIDLGFEGILMPDYPPGFVDLDDLIEMFEHTEEK